MNRKDRPLHERVEAREFDAGVVAFLDTLDADVVRNRLGDPEVHRYYGEPVGYWRVGDGRPSLASEEPAVMEAMGRCATARTMADGVRLPIHAIHPAECGWCEYPLEQLLAACDWATWHSRWLSAEVWIWRGQGVYARTVRADVYDNPAWARFYALPARERRYRIEQAAAA